MWKIVLTFANRNKKNDSNMKHNNNNGKTEKSYKKGGRQEKRLRNPIISVTERPAMVQR